MSTAKAGDVVELKDKDGGFTDPETGFDISRDQKLELEDPIGARTQEAIVSGGLLIVSGKASKSKTADTGGHAVEPSVYPEDYPGREALAAAGLTPEQVETMDKEALVAVKGIGDKTAEAILAYGK